MISEEQFKKELDYIISNAIREDVGDGDHSSLACIPDTARPEKGMHKDKAKVRGTTNPKALEWPSGKSERQKRVEGSMAWGGA